MTNEQIAQLKKIGSEWTSDDGSKHRIYFNDLPALRGLKAQYYNSGNISSATFEGEEISNSAAREWENKFNSCKLWFDLDTNEFGSRGFEKFQKSYKIIMAKIEEIIK